TPLTLRNITLRNRIVRSATYEGLGMPDGTPRPELADLYRRLAEGGSGTLITGFVFISQAGRAMQPNQCGIDSDAKAAAWRTIIEPIKRDFPKTTFIMQLAHTGRQTRSSITGQPALGVSDQACSYFRQRVHVLSDNEIETIIDEFAAAAKRAQNAGFDGVQLHAAHGYLIHQFLSPWTNNRSDRWGEPTAFLDATIRAVKSVCGDTYPVLLKLSAADDNDPGIRLEHTIETVRRIAPLGIDAVEISYGTMEHALNIMRGDCPIDLAMEINPLFTRIPRPMRALWKRFRAPAYTHHFIPFSPAYNLKAAAQLKKQTDVPVFSIGGFRDASTMRAAVAEGETDAISLCRPLIIDPAWPRKIEQGDSARSSCTNCNRCTIYCDASEPTRCRRITKEITS
ncbi:MAG: NADH:flavin oxidoreductase, partial [Pontiellaceae bacterium]|nr:NADH:flavin oxidoreductase [Pontiellaceae bacterium]